VLTGSAAAAGVVAIEKAEIAIVSASFPVRSGFSKVANVVAPLLFLQMWPQARSMLAALSQMTSLRFACPTIN